MRALFVSLLIPLLAACSTAAPSLTPSAASTVDVSGHWTGSWIGTGLFDSPREDSVTLDLRQQGYAGYGRLVFEGTTAAESVPWEIRREGLHGIRVDADVLGSEVRVRHELGPRVFAADFTLVSDDRMIGAVRGTAPGVRLVLTRVVHRAAPQAAAVVEPAPVKLETPPETETQEPDPVQYAAVMPAEEPQQQEEPAQQDAAPTRPHYEDFAAVPELKVVYFDFDKATLRADAVDALTADAEWLKTNDDTLVMIEGYCDEMGTTEYNQALGDRRAQAVRDILAASGVDAERMTTISYGKDRPVCTEETDDCRSQNRHVEFRVKSK